MCEDSGGDLVGYIWYTRVAASTLDLQPNPKLWIHAVFVEPHLPWQRVTSALYAALDEVAEAEDASELWLLSPLRPGLAAYHLGLGYIKVHSEFNQGAESIWMRSRKTPLSWSLRSPRSPPACSPDVQPGSSRAV